MLQSWTCINNDLFDTSEREIAYTTCPRSSNWAMRGICVINNDQQSVRKNIWTKKSNTVNRCLKVVPVATLRFLRNIACLTCPKNSNWLVHLPTLSSLSNTWQPAWHGEKYDNPSAPHTGLNFLLWQSQPMLHPLTKPWVVLKTLSKKVKEERQSANNTLHCNNILHCNNTLHSNNTL